jgi:ArsR family transcriptional regulator
MDALHPMADTFKLFADPSRLHLLALLREQELCVCELVELSGLSQPNVSQHIRKLKQGGLVAESKRGQWVYYSLLPASVDYLQAVYQALPSYQQAIRAWRKESEMCCETEADC